MKVRLAEEKDIDRISELLVQIGKLHHEARPDIFNLATPKFSAVDLCEIFEAPHKFILVAVDNADIVQGHLFCHTRESDGQGVIAKIKTMWVEDLCIDENCRGAGVGTLLFDALEELAREKGCDSITLNVWEFNESAINFYRKNGMSIQRFTLEKNIQD